jgi:hypothetical protein
VELPYNRCVAAEQREERQVAEDGDAWRKRVGGEVHFVQIELEFGSNMFCVELRPGNANSCALTGRNVTCINVVPVHK